MLGGAEYTKAWTLWCAADLSSNSHVSLESCLVAVRLFHHINSLLYLLLALTGLAFLADDILADITDALALIRLRRTLGAYFGSELTYGLLVVTADDDLARGGNINGDAVALRHDNLMGEASVITRSLPCFTAR